MKIHQIAQGARFHYDGQVYVKTGPMMARSESGEQRVIPRYVVLTPVDESASRQTEDRQNRRESVEQAFEQFFAVCSALVDGSAQPQLEAARARFLQQLKQG